MRIFLTIITIFSAIICLSGQTPGITLGGIGNDHGYSLCKTLDGGYVLAGSTRSFGEGSEDIFVVNIDEYGIQNWAKIYGDSYSDIVTNIQAVDNGYILTGSTRIWANGSDILLLKIDQEGEMVFEHTYGTNAKDAGHSIIQSAAGGYYILGYSREIEPHGDFILIKTDEEGNEVWRKNYGTDFDDVAFGLTEAEDGSILIFGSFGSFYYDIHYNFHNRDADMAVIKTDANGNELWRNAYGGDGHDLGYDIKASPDGGLYLFGSSQSYGAESFDMLLIKVTETGNQEWYKNFGGEDFEYGLSIDVNANSDVFLFGTTKSFGNDGSTDYYLIKTDADGNIIWETVLGGSDAEYGREVIATADSGCAVIGSTMSFGEGGNDLLFVKFDKDGVVENLLTGTPSFESQTTLVYPNPVSNSGRLKLKAGEHDYIMDILEANGNVVKRCALRSPIYEFHTERLPSGIYFYRIYKEKNIEQFITGKLFIQQ